LRHRAFRVAAMIRKEVDSEITKIREGLTCPHLCCSGLS
jgi:hypothetical protein